LQFRASTLEHPLVQPLNLPDHGVKLRHEVDGDRVWDPLRKKWLVLTPEEWVRQHVVNHLVHDLGCPASLISQEHTISLHGLTKRADVVVHDPAAKPLLLVECKAPQVKLDQAVFEQASRYNVVFRVRFLLVTNGLVHYCCAVDHRTGAVDFLPKVPAYKAMAEGV
jgi:Type I restriction enzyme R protein N terminus (HSDR_N)